MAQLANNYETFKYIDERQLIKRVKNLCSIFQIYQKSDAIGTVRAVILKAPPLP